MTKPDDHDWLLARERGDDISHVAPDARAGYDRLGELIESLPGEPSPAGWQNRVFAALDAIEGSGDDLVLSRSPLASDVRPPSSIGDVPVPSRPAEPADSPHRASRRANAFDPLTLPRRPARRRLVIAATAAAAAAIAIVVIVPGAPPPPAAEPVVAAEIRPGPDHRARGVALGDTLILRVAAPGVLELRSYGDTGEPLARCTRAAGCIVVRDGELRHYTLSFALTALGDVRTVLFRGELAAPPRDLTSDLAAARTAGIDARQIHVTRVQ